ncbi:NAD-dependent epimerase/dehydratase family protein [Pseudofrankia inefficax]|uniref:NAD-dependent epimerase/dehydratase n=1 Tax=Pseudofrankia inefficax (strain DSM 45817 / CECT 9037 / DDB 130130 / EuI1c) TaxID=298654 RepID=E3J8D1_PSEI1|nr:NAD-dependent epimerase/dehydratase family protein [Pseudofrankia inefficax]ADP84465.1 NAD-dependent epimerase/dehydratase [Pseudofrankia inefficax]
MDISRSGAARVVVVGASGNVGTGVLAALGGSAHVADITALARRPPTRPGPKISWRAADITGDDLAGVFAGADVVIHLAWLFQPTHDPAATWRTNVLGSARVFDAVARAGVPALVVASSVGAYSPGPPDDRAVEEDWPTDGWPGAAYTREKAYVERLLDVFERDHPRVRVVRLRPGFIFQRPAASQQRRLFMGPFVPGGLVRAATVPLVPDIAGLRFQVVHADDVAEAYGLAAERDVRGAFNIAAEPVVDCRVLADLLDARAVRMPPRAVRAALVGAWRLHLVPTDPGLFDAVMRLPVMSTARARAELGWAPRHNSLAALRDFLAGLQEGAGASTAALAPATLTGRAGEVLTGVGGRA